MILETFFHDLRIGGRVLIKEKSFCVLAVVVLALGICAVTTQFTVINATVLRTACAWLAVGCLVRRHVSAHASERPGPDLPDLLAEADPALGAAAQRWLRLADAGTAHTARLRAHREPRAEQEERHEPHDEERVAREPPRELRLAAGRGDDRVNQLDHGTSVGSER